MSILVNLRSIRIYTNLKFYFMRRNYLIVAPDGAEHYFDCADLQFEKCLFFALCGLPKVVEVFADDPRAYTVYIVYGLVSDYKV